MNRRLLDTLRSLLSGVAISTMLLATSGCAAHGARFEAVSEIPDGQALIYIYREKSFVGGGVRYHVADGDQRIVFLKNGGYCPYFSEPGEKHIWARTEAKSEVTIDAHPGEVYYIRASIVAGWGIGRPNLELVSNEVGENQIRKLKLLPRAEGPAQ